jgi:hypothetical protein
VHELNDAGLHVLGQRLDVTSGEEIETFAAL